MILFIINTVRVTEYRHTFNKNEDIALMGNIIEKHTPKNSRILLYQQKQDWSPSVMYLAHRRGTIVSLENLEKGDIQKIMKNYGCDYLVLVSESLTRLYKSGTGFRQLFYGKRDGDHDLDFSIKLTSNIEQKLSFLKLIYMSNRLRIYTR